VSRYGAPPGTWPSTSGVTFTLEPTRPALGVLHHHRPQLSGLGADAYR
jgi:hypothetical protein